MSDFLAYELAKCRADLAGSRRDYYSLAYDMAKAKERLAELRSQSFESIAGGKLAEGLAGEPSEREGMIQVSRYVITGRTDRV